MKKKTIALVLMFILLISIVTFSFYNINFVNRDRVEFLSVSSESGYEYVKSILDRNKTRYFLNNTDDQYVFDVRREDIVETLIGLVGYDKLFNEEGAEFLFDATDMMFEHFETVSLTYNPDDPEYYLAIHALEHQFNNRLNRIGAINNAACMITPLDFEIYNHRYGIAMFIPCDEKDTDNIVENVIDSLNPFGFELIQSYYDSENVSGVNIEGFLK